MAAAAAGGGGERGGAAAGGGGGEEGPRAQGAGLQGVSPAQLRPLEPRPHPSDPRRRLGPRGERRRHAPAVKRALRPVRNLPEHAAAQGELLPHAEGGAGDRGGDDVVDSLADDAGLDPELHGGGAPGGEAVAHEGELAALDEAGEADVEAAAALGEGGPGVEGAGGGAAGAAGGSGGDGAAVAAAGEREELPPGDGLRLRLQRRAREHARRARRQHVAAAARHRL